MASTDSSGVFGASNTAGSAQLDLAPLARTFLTREAPREEDTGGRHPGVLGVAAKARATAPSPWQRDAEMLRRRGSQSEKLDRAGRVARRRYSTRRRRSFATGLRMIL